MVVSRRTTTADAQKTKQETENPQRDPEKVKRAKLYDVLIISSIGIIGFGYLIIRRLFSTKVHAKSVEGVSQENALSSLDESGKKDVLNEGESEETPMQKKRKTFRESRVINDVYKLCYLMCINYVIQVIDRYCSLFYHFNNSISINSLFPDWLMTLVLNLNF